MIIMSSILPSFGMNTSFITQNPELCLSATHIPAQLSDQTNAESRYRARPAPVDRSLLHQPVPDLTFQPLLGLVDVGQ